MTQNCPQRVTVATLRGDHFSASILDYREGIRQSWHHHDDLILTLMLAGHTREQVKCQDVVAGPLDIGLKPPGLRHTDHFSPDGVRAVRIVLSPTFFDRLGVAAIQLERWAWLRGSPATPALLSVARGLQENDFTILDDLYDAVATLLSLPPNDTNRVPPRWLELARESWNAGYARPLRLMELAKEADLHPVYFARQFRRFFGCSVGQYIRQLQFQTSVSLLSDPKLSLAEIANHLGYADQPHMTRTFSRYLRITPAKFREMLK